jgi:hypothetical protein
MFSNVRKDREMERFFQSWANEDSKENETELRREQKQWRKEMEEVYQEMKNQPDPLTDIDLDNIKCDAKEFSEEIPF